MQYLMRRASRPVGARDDNRSVGIDLIGGNPVDLEFDDIRRFPIVETDAAEIFRAPSVPFQQLSREVSYLAAKVGAIVPS